MPRWFHNGRATNTIPINDRGLQYADGLFETIARRENMPRHWDFHVERVRTGCRRLSIEPPAPKELLQLVSKAIAESRNETRDALLKIIVTRGEGKRGYGPPADARTTVLVGVFERKKYPDSYYQQGVVTRVCSTRLSIQPLTAGIKLLSRVDQVLARAEWQDPGIAEGLMLEQGGSIVCGTMSNVFIVSNGQLLTPEITQCGVSGIMRRHILALAIKHDLPTEVSRVPVDMINTADEMFFCNSQFGIWPVSRCGRRTFGEWPVTRNMMTLLRQSGVIEGPA